VVAAAADGELGFCLVSVGDEKVARTADMAPRQTRGSGGSREDGVFSPF
jgi:hypothetical protein